MKKKNIALYFLKSLLKSVLVIVSVLLVGVISYGVSYTVLSKQASKSNTSENEIKEIVQQAKTDDISTNLIYVYKQDNTISHMMLEICNTKTNNMDYVTIPVTTDYTIPTTMYRKLYTVNEEIPQIMRLSKIRKYFTDDQGYGYGELIMEKLLGVEISYYTAIPEETYNNHYTEQKTTTQFTKNGVANTVTMKVSVLSDSYKNQLSNLKDEESLADFIKAQYEKVTSNLTVYNKIGYIESYEKMKPQNFHYWGIPGKYSGKIFKVSSSAAKQCINDLKANTEAYTTPQDFSAEATNNKVKTISSKGKKILILNGSKITGLASSIQATLQEAGFTVPKIGDYTKSILTQTNIIVKKEGMGQDLASYFKNPKIKVGTVDKGYDIKIIIGTVDAN